MQSAACRGSALKISDREHDIFFPGRGETPEGAILRFCVFCTVRKECDDYADRVDARSGVWGGKRRTRASHGVEG